MRSMRAFLHNRGLAMWLVALTMCLKVMVPQGFMVGASPSLSITICAGQGPELTQQIVLPPAHAAHELPGDHGKAADTCPYAALGMAGLAGAPAQLLVVGLAFIVARKLWPAPRPQPAPRSFLRPPLRGPPA